MAMVGKCGQLSQTSPMQKRKRKIAAFQKLVDEGLESGVSDRTVEGIFELAQQTAAALTTFQSQMIEKHGLLPDSTEAIREFRREI